jgi:endonuclease YncB( thermonuclease family)
MEFEVVDIPNITDGDTLWVVRRRVVEELETGLLIYQDFPGGIKVRLHDNKNGLNTPEKKDKDAWLRAKKDLQYWVGVHLNERKRLVDYGKDGFGRRLANIFVGEAGVVEFMVAKGWSTYK